MRRVIVATPAKNGALDMRYVHALTESIKLALGRGVELLPLFVGNGPVETLRDDLLALAVQARGIDDVVWIDADIQWAPEWVLRLLDHPVDVVGGTYRRKQEGEAYVVGAAPEQLAVDARGLMQVNHLGFGFLRTTRRALEALWAKGERYAVAGSERRCVFEWPIVGGERISEDVSTCRKLRAAGFAINLDPTICCNHVGEVLFAGNFVDWAKRLQADRARDAKRRRKGAHR
jgi:glycosyltransferase involved in cell wall biosynthesis